MNTPHEAAPLWVDDVNQCVHHGGRPLKLTPKAFAVLRHLMERPGTLATKDELLAVVWPNTVVTEASLSTCIREIRRALNDQPLTPAYIQTLHRRGYRYVGPVAVARPYSKPVQARSAAEPLFAGRERELALLDRAWCDVQRGQRRLILFAGEAGIGKTALIERFIGQTIASTAQVATGQCVEQYGACEAYLPWLDLLNHLLRDYGRELLTNVLRRCAPMWLAQLPWLIDGGERQQLQREIAGATPERMIRELAEAFAVLSAGQPMVLVLEDLHWSDPSSIDMLAHLARRATPGSILMIGTYRAAELHASSHPLLTLKQDLLLHGACEDVALDFLTADAVARYVDLRLPGAPDSVARDIHRRTDGNPLFMVTMTEYLLARGALVQVDGSWLVSDDGQITNTEVPESLRGMIERQLDRLRIDDQRVLEAASVAGAAFSAASIAAILGEALELTEERLDRLAARASLVRATGSVIWPDGIESDGYAFIHVLYQQVLYERIGAARRSRMHRLVAARLETGYGQRAPEIAAELALHFQRGRDARRAVGYLTLAGENAMRRGAYVEAIALLHQGLAGLSLLPEGTDRDACEIALRVPLGVCYVNTRGYAAAEVGVAFERAHDLCQGVAESPHAFRVLRGLWFFSVQRADLPRARSIAEELLRVASRIPDGSGLVEAHRILAATWFHLGDFARAREHVQQGVALYDADRHSEHALLFGQDPGVCSYAWQSWILWYSGYPDQAAVSATRGIELARRLDHPFSLAFALNFAARVHDCRGDAATSESYAAEGIRCARGQGLSSMLAMAQVLHGWSRTLLGSDDAGVQELREGVSSWKSTGASLATPYWTLLLASALDIAGRHLDAMDTLDDALTQSGCSDERWFEPELYIQRASQAARRSPRADRYRDAERHLRRAYEIADRMQSPSLRLRVANALARVLCAQRKKSEASDLVDAAYSAFTEGLGTSDLIEAKALLSNG